MGGSLAGWQSWAYERCEDHGRLEGGEDESGDCSDLSSATNLIYEM